MFILTIRTDKPEAELGLFEDEDQLTSLTWQAHRQLAETVHVKIKEMLESQKKELNDLGGIVAFQGPGSFTGLRIGLSVANAFADSLQIPIVATAGKDWIESGITRLQAGENDHIALPEYGAPPRTTRQKR